MNHRPFDASPTRLRTRAFAGTRWLAVAALAAVALTSPAHAQQNTGPIKLGLLTPFGGQQIGGKSVSGAAQMAIDDFGGKVLGRNIQLLVGDEQGKADVALAIARQWVDQEKITALFANTNSATTFAFSEITKPAKIPLQLVGPGSEDFTGVACSEFSTSYIWNVYSLPRAVISGVSREGVKNWYIITVDNAFGKSAEANAREFIAASGGQVVGSGKFPASMQDYSSVLLRAQASKADAIALGTTGENSVSLIKQADEFGIMKAGQKIAVLSMNIQDVHALGLEQAKGLKMVAPFYHDLNDETRAWTKRYLKYSDGRMPTFMESGVYSSMEHYLKAVQAAGTTDGPAVMAKLKTVPLDNFEMKNVSRRDDGQMMRPMYLLQVKTKAESKAPWDYYKVERTVPADEAWRPVAESKCPLLRKQ
jgi:branched-chain amino acid transport system substrate-binding protein